APLLSLYLSLSLSLPVNRELLILLIMVAFAHLYKKTRLQTLAKYSGLIYFYFSYYFSRKHTNCFLILVSFVLQLNFVRFYLPLLAAENHERIVYLDDDVIVQGEIHYYVCKPLKWTLTLHLYSYCDLPPIHEMVRSVGMQTTYMGFLDYRKEEVRELGISPNLGECKKQKVTKQLEKRMAKNVTENLYSSAMAGGVATPPMLIVFHDKYTTIDPLWCVRHLGWSPDTRYPRSFLKDARLLHWNGHPTGKCTLVRL
uniref:Glycosyltransferase 8 domain containing 2 n=1 Tax=Sinocyclocheilus rhinocerous TaxID=307959 RepID=A0A673J8E9_9TELE